MSSHGRLARIDVLALLPATLALAVVIGWAATGGGYESLPALDAGYDPGPWYLGALALVALLCVSATALARLPAGGALRLACACLGGYVIWSYLSVLWAHDQGVALLGSNRTLVYFAAFALFAILPWRSFSARVALGVLVSGIGVLAAVAAAKVALLTDPSGLYIGERLAYPLGYYNADAALFMTATVVAIGSSAQRSTPALLRVGGCVVAALCLQLAVLSQSRGWLFTAPLVLLAMLVLLPGRLRLLTATALPALATAAAAPALLAVYGKSTPNGNSLAQPRLSHVLHQQGAHAIKTILLIDVLLVLAATLIVALDRRVSVGRSVTQSVNRLAGRLAALVVLAGVAAGLVAVHGDPIGRVERAWHSFADSGRSAGGGYSHFGTLASNRADIWRVALHEFAEHPITGIGQDNFASAYTRLRHSDELPRWVHSIELRLLTHSGLVGALLFAAFLASALLAALGRRVRRSPQRATAGLLLLPLVVWLGQGSIDWFWEYPVLSVPALAFAAAAGAMSAVRIAKQPSTAAADASLTTAAATMKATGPLIPGAPATGTTATGTTASGPTPSGTTATGARTNRRRATVGWLLAGLLAAGSFASLIIPFLAARHAQRATELWQQHPALAFSELRSATNLMPFYSQLYLVGGAIALNLGELEGARGWFEQARRREHQSWLVPFSLGLIDGEQGKLQAADAELREARTLNPGEPVLELALERVHERKPLTFSEAQEAVNPHIVTPHA